METDAMQAEINAMLAAQWLPLDQAEVSRIVTFAAVEGISADQTLRLLRLLAGIAGDVYERGASAGHYD